jgi:viologen exporter family transport system permease protein
VSGLAAPRAATYAERFPAYWKIATMTAERLYSYRLNIGLELVGLLLQVLLLKVVWTAVYEDRGAIEGADLPTLLTYLTIANFQIWVVWPETTWLLRQKIREGKIAQDLARPIGLMGQLLGHQVGSTLVILPSALVALPFAFFVGVLRPPASVEAGLLYLASVLLAYVVVTWIGLLMGLTAFWTLETGGIEAIYRFLNLFFAGALVPLWLFPDGLRVVAELLPFQTQGAIPVSIFVGRLTGLDALRGLAVQAVWALLLGLFTHWVYSRAIRKVVVQGG